MSANADGSVVKVRPAYQRGLTPFPPGTTGNPIGQNGQAGLAWRTGCREWMTAEGWAHLQAIARNYKSRNQTKALELIAAYAYGRPSQRHEILVDDTGARSLVDGLTQMMAEDLARRRLAERGAVVEGAVVKEETDAGQEPR